MSKKIIFQNKNGFQILKAQEGKFPAVYHVVTPDNPMKVRHFAILGTTKDTVDNTELDTAWVYMNWAMAGILRNDDQAKVGA